MSKQSKDGDMFDINRLEKFKSRRKISHMVSTLNFAAVTAAEQDFYKRKRASSPNKPKTFSNFFFLILNKS
jgi:hypothetical protein